jgi:hypothetical protein
MNVVYDTLFYDVMQYGYEYHSIVLTITKIHTLSLWTETVLPDKGEQLDFKCRG